MTGLVIMELDEDTGEMEYADDQDHDAVMDSILGDSEQFSEPTRTSTAGNVLVKRNGRWVRRDRLGESFAEFDESKHPRADDGKFGTGGGASFRTTKSITKGGSLKGKPAVDAGDLQDGMVFWDGSIIRDVTLTGKNSVSFSLDHPELDAPLEKTARRNSVIALADTHADAGAAGTDDATKEKPARPKPDKGDTRELGRLSKEIRKAQGKLVDLRMQLTHNEITKARFDSKIGPLKKRFDDLRDELDAIKPTK